MTIEFTITQFLCGPIIVLVALLFFTCRYYVKYHRLNVERFDLMDQIGDLLLKEERAWDIYSQHGAIIRAVDANDLKEAVILSAGSYHPIVCVEGRSQNPKVYESYAASMGVTIPKPITLKDFIGKVHTNGIILAL